MPAKAGYGQADRRQADARAQEIRAGLAWLHAADPVLAQVIDDRPDFDPDVWMRRLPAMNLFGALVFQIIGQQISVAAARTVLGRLTTELGASELPDPILVPHLDGDVHDIAGLERIRRFLFASEAERDQLIDRIVA